MKKKHDKHAPVASNPPKRESVAERPSKRAENDVRSLLRPVLTVKVEDEVPPETYDARPHDETFTACKGNPCYESYAQDRTPIRKRPVG
jgi:hypothetical protein